MERIVHAANICNVGYTQIHAWMTPKDMRYLLKEIPDGRFTPTWGGALCRIDTPDKLEEYIENQNKGFYKDYHLHGMGFYFMFKFDLKGLNLLKNLNLEIKWEHPWGIVKEENIL